MSTPEQAPEQSEEPAPEPAPGASPRGRRVVVVPPAPVLLPEYASLVDPVADLRAACLAAVAWLGDDVRVVAADEQGRWVGEHLLGSRSSSDAAGAAGADVLLLANGSARRTEKAPGHLDERAAGFDAWVGELLSRGDLGSLADLDLRLADELLTTGLPCFGMLANEGVEVTGAVVDHAEDPFGVMYWVVRWQCAS